MARYREGHKAASRAGIVGHASRRLRQDGLSAGLRAILADAGLTHGGFYAHFASRDALIAEAVAHANETAGGYLVRAVASAGEGQKLRALVDAYLGLLHRGDIAQGCVLAALAPEIARQMMDFERGDMVARNRTVQLIETHLPPGGGESERRARAFGIFAGMMGTLQLMRVASKEADVDALMQAGRQAALLIAGQPWKAAAAAEDANRRSP